MGDSFEDFAKALDSFNDYAEKQATRNLRRISTKALQLIVEGTPVLTGCCRGNWQVSTGELSRNFDSKKKDLSGETTIRAGLARIESAKLGTDVLIENSTPYVMRLENGWSRQKPAGSMIREPLAKLKQAVANGAR